MAGPPTPLPVRASDAEREYVARRLRDGVAEGRISWDTWSYRVDRAYASRSKQELAGLLGDLPAARRWRSLVIAAVEVASEFVASIEAAWRWARLDRLTLPRSGTAMRRVYVLGRELDCDVVLSDPSVSRHHAVLRRDGHRWLLEDLGSTNGTRVNGSIVVGPTRLLAGDCVALGSLTLIVGER